MPVYPFTPRKIPQGNLTQEHYERIANAIAPDFDAPKVSQMFLGDDLDENVTMDDIYYESLKCLLALVCNKYEIVDVFEEDLDMGGD